MAAALHDQQSGTRCTSPSASARPPLIAAQRHYAASSHSILLNSSLERSQAANVEDCFRRLHTVLLEAAELGVRGDTSEATRDRVRHHKAVANARAKSFKKMRAATKKSRSSGMRDM